MTALSVRRSLILVAIAAICWPALERQTAAQGRQRAMYVGVYNDAGLPVPDLGPADFVVREDNVAREVLKVEPAVDPMQIAILIDTSTAARDAISHMRTALPPFVQALTAPNTGGVKNEVALIAFGERPTVFTDYTTSAATLEKGMGRIWAMPGSGAYFLDAIVETTKALKKREAKRPVIVGLVIEGGELSYSHDKQALEALRESGASLNALMLGTPSSSMTDEMRSRSIVLDTGIKNSGGFHDQLLANSALTDRLKKLADQLTHQYKVTYGHPDTLIPPEKVTVTAKNPALVAHGVLMREDKGRQ
jgi:hypothetical protein